METGYRVGYNIKDCACSIFLFHNEIWNIWTHLLPAIIISFSYILLFQKGFFEMSHWFDSLMIHVNFCGTIIGLSLSSIYHTFNCNSKQVHNCLLCCDMGGAIFFMVSVMMPSVHFAFYRYPTLHTFYISLSTLIFILGLSIAVFSNHPKYGYSLRIVCLPLLNCIGIWILFHLYLIIPSDEWNLWSPYQYTLISLIVGIYLYIIKFPERWFPAFCEKTHLYSHGLWHLCTDITAIIGCIQIIRVSRAKNECIA